VLLPRVRQLRFIFAAASRSTCPPISPPPLRKQLCTRSCSNKHAHMLVSSTSSEAYSSLPASLYVVRGRAGLSAPTLGHFLPHRAVGARLQSGAAARRERKRGKRGGEGRRGEEEERERKGKGRQTGRQREGRKRTERQREREKEGERERVEEREKERMRRRDTTATANGVPCVAFGTALAQTLEGCTLCAEVARLDASRVRSRLQYFG
jgi:hypothetical protein